MTQPAKPTKNEAARLLRLKQLMVLDTAPEPLFDEITKLASQISGAPIAMISLVDEDRQWFKANVGIEGTKSTSRDIAFCAHAILDDQILEVEDATKDKRFAANPLVTTDPNIRFYAGAPLALTGDLNVGTLCVIDQAPRKLNALQKEVLAGLAAITCKALLVRETAMRAVESQAVKLAAIIEDSDDAIISKTLDGIVTSWNASAERMFGYRADEMIGQSITQLFPKDRIDEEKFLLKKIKNDIPVKHYETVRRTKNGKLIQLSVTLSPIRNALGEMIGVSKIARDITQQKKLEQKLAQQYAHLQVTMDAIADALISTDIDGYIEYVNPVALALTGLTLNEAKGKLVTEAFHLVYAETRELVRNPLALFANMNELSDLAGHKVVICPDGSERVVENNASFIHDADGKRVGVVLVLHDVTIQRKLTEEISFRASHDTLTGLLNRSEFDASLNHLLSDMRTVHQQHALMYIDLDRFKVINDTCGHSAGDVVLKDVANIMQGCVRSSDILARVGGDEFAIVLQKCDCEHAMKLAKSICQAVNDYHFYRDGECFRVGASIGLVMIDQRATSASRLIQAADSACYQAKYTGRNRVHLCLDQDSALDAHRGETKWVSRIEKALEEKGFMLFCQRIMPLSHQGLEHAEILIRMLNEDGTLIQPSAFLPAAERFHLASRIDRYVLKEVLSWMASNTHSLSHIESISINLSGQSLSDLTFHRDALKMIREALVDTSKLCFEITETAAITNIAEAKKFIAELNQYGVKFALDDFGSGVSSFGYLKNLDVDYLKIDGQFITDLLQNDIGQATVRCIAEVAKATGKKTIAEWVENKPVENMLKKMGIDFTQGYLKHNPAPLDFLLGRSCAYQSQASLQIVDDMTTRLAS
jgi:diguanylate cyclase (GGDEF)-like protein/PAS domain S-box-containing protein